MLRVLRVHKVFRAFKDLLAQQVLLGLQAHKEQLVRVDYRVQLVPIVIEEQLVLRVLRVLKVLQVQKVIKVQPALVELDPLVQLVLEVLAPQVQPVLKVQLAQEVPALQVQLATLPPLFFSQEHKQSRVIKHSAETPYSAEIPY